MTRKISKTPKQFDKSMKKQQILILLGVIVLLVAIGLRVLILKNLEKRERTIIYAGINAGLTEPSPVPYNPPARNYYAEPPQPTTKIFPKEYKTRFFDVTEDFRKNKKYPSEITDVPENSLVPISCTHRYSRDGKEYGFYDKKDNQIVLLTDKSLLNYLNILQRKYKGKTVNTIAECSSEDGKKIILYALDCTNRQACFELPHIGIVKNSTILELAKIDEPVPYFGCYPYPLQLTKDNNYYFECGGADGAFSSVSIYKLNLSSKKLERIVHCTSTLDLEKCE